LPPRHEPDPIGDDAHEEPGPVRAARVVRGEGDAASERDDAVAHEEPLELQIQGVPVAVVMRTPGHDEELALGFLLTERVVAGAAEVASIRHCTTARSPEAEGNVVRVVLREGVEPPLERLRRNLYASSSCGVCGKASIENAVGVGGPVAAEPRFAPRVLYGLPNALRAQQAAFASTGGLHAAALFDAEGRLAFVREDVGRHNAVDKLVGAAARAAIPIAEHGLFVSGRVSFELVQKAAAAGIALVAGISAPTSLAVRAGETLGVTVIGFVRGATMNVYSHARRIAVDTPP